MSEREQLLTDCRRDASAWLHRNANAGFHGSFERLTDHLAELMADKAELLVALELANNRLATEPRFMEQIAFALLRYQGGELLVPYDDIRAAGTLFHEIEECDMLHIACEDKPAS